MTAIFQGAESAESFDIEGGTRGSLYDHHPEGDHTVAQVQMDGTYPVTGYSINERCTETLFVLCGEIRVRADDDRFVLSPGDMLIIRPGTRYRIEGSGKCLDIITPQWDKAQNRVEKDKEFIL